MQRTPRLRELRERAALSQEDVAERSGVARATIADLEAGKRPARPSTIRKLAKGLDVEVTALYGEPESPKVPAPSSQEKLFNNGDLEEERRADWGAAVDKARRLREYGRPEMEDALASWRASKEREEDADERRAYLDKMGELLQEAYDAETALLKALYEPHIAEQWPEVQVADRFYVELWRLVQEAGLSIYTGADAAASSSVSAGLEGPPARTSAETAPHSVKEPEAA
jgi:transcriptional regulator with XRE-family HTH domain